MREPKPQQLSTSAPISLIYGSSAALRGRLVESIIDANLPGEDREWGLEIVDAQEIGAAGAAGQLAGGSLMAQSRVVVIRNAEKLPAAQQGIIAKALQRLAPGTMVVIDAASSDDYRKKGAPVSADLRKAVEAAGQIVEATTPGDRDLPGWVIDEVAAHGKRMPMAAARAFVDTVGAQVDQAINELDKLLTYVGPEQEEVTVADVRAVVSGERESTVFDLVDAIGRRDARTALEALPDLLPASGAQGAAMPLLAMVARQLRLVWQAKALQNAGLSLEDAKRLPADWSDKLPGEHNFFDSTRGRSFLTRKYAEQARNFSDVQLVRAFAKVYETDLALKGQTRERMDDRLALEMLIVDLCRL